MEITISVDGGKSCVMINGVKLENGDYTLKVNDGVITEISKISEEQSFFVGSYWQDPYPEQNMTFKNWFPNNSGSDNG